MWLPVILRLVSAGRATGTHLGPQCPLVWVVPPCVGSPVCSPVVAPPHWCGPAPCGHPRQAFWALRQALFVVPSAPAAAAAVAHGPAAAPAAAAAAAGAAGPAAYPATGRSAATATAAAAATPHTAPPAAATATHTAASCAEPAATTPTTVAGTALGVPGTGTPHTDAVLPATAETREY